MPEEQREKKPVIDSRASSDAQARPSQHPRIAKSAARKSASIGSNVQGRSRPSTSRTQHSSAQALMATKSSAARKLTLVDGQDSFRRISKTLATPSAQDPFPVTKASAARKLTLIDDQDNSGNAPQAPAPNLATLLVKSSAARKLTLIDEQDSFRSRPSSSKPLPQTSDRSVASSLRVMPSKRGILSQPHFGLDRLQRPESLVEWRTSAARKNVQLMPPPAAPLAAARKYVAQQGRRLAASPPPKLMAAKKSAPQAALWAPSMRPAINPSSNKLPDPHHARASSNVPEQVCPFNTCVLSSRGSKHDCKRDPDYFIPDSHYCRHRLLEGGFMARHVSLSI
jgi:hypothetical protein